MKTPEKIKLGIECCIFDDESDCGVDCPYAKSGIGCKRKLWKDACNYIDGNTGKASAWISTKDRMPESGDLVMVLASGKPRENIILENAYLIASYWESEGWIADGYEGWEPVEVSFWMPLPDEPWKRDYGP